MELLIEGAIGWAVGRVGDSAGNSLKDRLSDRQAKNELIALIRTSIQGAVDIAPTLEEDFQSESFLQRVLVPSVLKFLTDPTLEFDKESAVADQYVEVFVKPYLRGRSPDETLARLFLTNKATLLRAITRFFSLLRSELYTSKHWKEKIRDRSFEEMRSSILRIERCVAPPSSDPIDIDAARIDAATGSNALRGWMKTIEGRHIDRPELEELLQRIRDHPFAGTLVIGEAGAGKSALFAVLVSRLEEMGMVVFAIKADLLPTDVRTLDDISKALGLRGHILKEIDALARVAPVVVLIDQLDAVSDVMDRSSERMSLLLQIARHFQDRKRRENAEPPVHVVVSSRQFEADYDARFQSLNAEVVRLSLLTHEQVDWLLTELGISAATVPLALRETLRRPFALRLFVEIMRRGAPTDELIPAELLTAWLATANLGDSESRREALELLRELAVDMTENESLWRPADRYDMESPRAVGMAVASGLLTRQGGLLGFSHQAWLDDFQAKQFSSAQALVDFAWQRQEGLFARATILRALQRLRAVDSPAYANALDSLLGAGKTRRHLQHLVVDLIAGQQTPLAREIAWILSVIRNDTALARRALTRAASHWEVWREHLRSLFPLTMGSESLRSHAAQLLITEAQTDPAHVLERIASHWGSPEHDLRVLHVFVQATLWSPEVVERLGTIFRRHEIDTYLIAGYAKNLGDERAAQLLGVFLEHLDYKKEERLQFHDLEKLVERLPLAFAKVLFPWFVGIAGLENDGSRSLRDVYPASSSLPHFWDDNYTRGSLYRAVKQSLRACAKELPDAYLSLVHPYLGTEIEEVQALLAEGFAAGGSALVDASIEFLLADSRRLQLGVAHLTDTGRVMHLIQGWSSVELLRAIVPHASRPQLECLREHIEHWNPYKDEAWKTDDPRTRLSRYAWAEEKRFPLLEAFPTGVLAPRRHRQVSEWRAKQPVYQSRRGPTLMSVVRSPMSAQQMASASDEEVFKLIDEVSDGTERWERAIKSRQDGGSRQLGDAFAEFGKAHPERALSIAESWFKPSRHETAAGALLGVIAKNTEVDTQCVLELIRRWQRDGFSSVHWRRDAAWALQAIAKRSDGLCDDDIALLESWIDSDPTSIAERVRRHAGIENRHHRAELRDGATAVVFRQFPGGMKMLPQDNYTMLSAMAAGWLARGEPAAEAWLGALERHIQRPEDPEIWTALLIFQMETLHWTDRGRTYKLFEAVWERFPEAFSDLDVAYDVWRHRELWPEHVSKAIHDAWLASGNPRSQQAVGELLMAAVVLGDSSDDVNQQLDAVLSAPPSPVRLGALFTAAVAWNEDHPEVRERAHRVLARFAPQATGEEAEAIASAVTSRNSIPGDRLARELFESIAGNPEVLKVCLGRSFVGTLQNLLLSPGFETLVLRLAQRCTDLMLATDRQAVRMPYGESLVAISVALQRSPEPIRTQAMDLYESLLDGAAYGAEEAASASLVRHIDDLKSSR